MRSTLFYIPHEIFGVPLLGFSWLLLALFVGFLTWAFVQSRRGQFWSELSSGLPVWLIAAALVIFVLPQIETRWPDGEAVGLPVRGYGVMVLLGLFAGIGLTVWRGQQVGVSTDLIVSLGFWMMLGGVIGARIFFVFQYWNEFAVYEPGERLIAILKLTEGGLVIYGGMVGGSLAGALFCWVYKQPTLAMADLSTPGFLIGLAFGRLGCLLNGCCYGGVCTAELPAIRFPQGSPPYVAQLENGRLIGLTVRPSAGRELEVISVEPGSIAEQKLRAAAGMHYAETHSSLPPVRNVDDPARTPQLVASLAVDDRTAYLTPNELPAWSLPVHPSQIYSAVDALLLCLLVIGLQPSVLRDGHAFFIGVGLHGISRFTLELIRSDEAGQFGTALTIAQWISITGILLALVALLITLRLPRARALPWQI